MEEREVNRAERVADEDSQDDSWRMSIQSLPGSNCEVTFEGVLHFERALDGEHSIRGGPLVITKKGRVDVADIDVGVAISMAR